MERQLDRRLTFARGAWEVGTLARVRGALVGIDGQPLADGDRVVFFDVHRTYGRRHACAVTRTPSRCEAHRVYGITHPANEGLFGGWADAIDLEPGAAATRLPDA